VFYIPYFANATNFKKNKKDTMATELEVKGKKIRMKTIKGKQMFSLTDIANQFGEGPTDRKIYSWFKNRNTQDFLEAYEEEYNPKFKPRKAKKFKERVLENSNSLSLGDYERELRSPFISVQRGKNGSWAIFQISLEFMTWISTKFKVWFIADYERMKIEEMKNKLRLDKFYTQKNIDNLMEALRYEQDRLNDIEGEQKQLE